MIFIVVPAFNEEEKIGRVIRDLFEHGWNNVVVVDDGSLDNTAAVARLAGAKVLRHELNCGQGAALQTGNEFALKSGAGIIVHFDADCQFHAADIGPAIDKMRDENVDVVLGSRFLDNRSSIPWLKKKIVLPVSRFAQNIFTGVKLSDVHNGFRVLSRRAARKIEINQRNMAHSSEIISEIKRHKLSFAEHPVEVTYNEYGQGALGGVKILRDLLLDKFI